MKNYTFFIGIDISKETLDFALIVNNVLQFHLQVTNDKLGIEQFIKQVKKYDKAFSFGNSLFYMEHTGIYNNPLLSYLHQKHANVWLEQATQIKASMGVSREKNDVDDQSKSIHKKLAFMLIKIVKMSNCGHPNALLLFKETV